jgi:cytoskeletal protein CcmA (bactofilin family)
MYKIALHTTCHNYVALNVNEIVMKGNSGHTPRTISLILTGHVTGNIGHTPNAISILLTGHVTGNIGCTTGQYHKY